MKKSSSPLFDRNPHPSSSDYYDTYQQKLLVENMSKEINKLQHINIDLEHRLEAMAKDYMDIEAECIEIERAYKKKNESLLCEIERMKQEQERERGKTMKLKEQLTRTEKGLHGILQRKYELLRGPKGQGNLAGGQGETKYEAEFEIEKDSLMSSGNETQILREKRTMAYLSDFLGF